MQINACRKSENVLNIVGLGSALVEKKILGVLIAANNRLTADGGNDARTQTCTLPETPIAHNERH